MKSRQQIIYLTVTNSLSYDQRMSRICGTLHRSGYQVHLVGIESPDTLPDRPYDQIRLSVWFRSGKLFYLENHIRLFFFLLFRKADLLVSNDLDTALPVWTVSVIRRIPRLMDAHEFYTEMKEVMTRPTVQWIWKGLARFLIPRYPVGYTVSENLVQKFRSEYGVEYGLVRNFPIKQSLPNRKESTDPFLLYQGAVNHGRGFETLIPAMRFIRYPLVICGDGNFMDQLKELINQEGVNDRVKLTGMIPPSELREWSLRATIGISLPDREGANQFLALTNKFLNSIEAALPQITCRFPEYEKVNGEFDVAVLLDSVDPHSVADAVNELIGNAERRMSMQQACLKAREWYCWENEELSLTRIYKRYLNA